MPKSSDRMWVAMVLCMTLCGLHGPFPLANAAAMSSPPSSPRMHPVFYNHGEPHNNHSQALASVLSPEERDALDASVSIDQDVAWERYHSYLMSTRRTAPFVVLFSSVECPSINDDDDELMDMDTTDTSVEGLPNESCHEQQIHDASVVAATRLALSKGFPSTLPVVHITRAELPKAFDLHRVSSFPSLMWFPPRSTGTFQRYAHPQTNFLDLSLATQHSASDDVLVETVISFLKRSYALSSLSIASAASRYPVEEGVVEEENASIASSILNMLPLLAIAAYVLLTAIEHRTVVQKVVQSRLSWLLLTQMIVYVALSGFLHSIILRTPAFYAHPYYGFYFVHPSGRKQFFLEGLLHGSWSFAISFALFSIVDIMPSLRSKYARDELFRMALLVVGVSYILLHLTFTAKHRWLAR